MKRRSVQAPQRYWFIYFFFFCFALFPLDYLLRFIRGYSRTGSNSRDRNEVRRVDRYRRHNDGFTVNQKCISFTLVFIPLFVQTGNLNRKKVTKETKWECSNAKMCFQIFESKMRRKITKLILRTFMSEVDVDTIKHNDCSISTVAFEKRRTNKAIVQSRTPSHVNRS